MSHPKSNTVVTAHQVVTYNGMRGFELTVTDSLGHSILALEEAQNLAGKKCSALIQDPLNMFFSAQTMRIYSSQALPNSYVGCSLTGGHQLNESPLPIR